MPAVNDEQLRVERSLGTDMWRSMRGSLSMIMSVDWVRGGKLQQDIHAFVLVLYALFDRVCGSAKDGTPYLCVDRHERGEEAYFALWGL